MGVEGAHEEDGEGEGVQPPGIEEGDEQEGAQLPGIEGDEQEEEGGSLAGQGPLKRPRLSDVGGRDGRGVGGAESSGGAAPQPPPSHPLLHKPAGSHSLESHSVGSSERRAEGGLLKRQHLTRLPLPSMEALVGEGEEGA